MRYVELIEGVAAKGRVDLAAYALTVAEAYDAAPTHDASALKHWEELKRHTVEVLFKRISGSGIDIRFTASDPYGDAVGTDDPRMQIRYMLYDMAFNNRLFIYTGDSEHPNFSPQENWIFRTVHDYFTHGTLLKTFKNNFLEMFPNHKGKPTPDMLMKALPQVSLSKGGNRGFGFNARGEMNAASRHIRLAPKAASPALFTEVVGQVCYQRVVGDFPTQKVVVLEGFDYQKIGLTKPGSKADRRKQEILKMISEGVLQIQSTIKAKPVIIVADLIAAMTAET